MTENSALSPSLRVENGDYHYQSMRLLMKIISFYDALIKTAPYIKISRQTIWELQQKRQVEKSLSFLDERKLSRESSSKAASEKLYWLLKIVPSSEDSTDTDIHIYKRSLVEHGQLQHLLERLRVSLEKLPSLPSVPARMLGQMNSDEDRPVTEMFDVIQKDSDLDIDIELLKAEMVLVGVIQSGSSISGKAYEKFFSLLNDTSVMLKLELFKKIVEVTFATTKQVWAQLYQNSEETSSKYPYPPDFQPSEDIKAVLAEEAPKSKEFYDTILAGIIGTEQVLHSSASALNNSNDNSLSKGRKDGQPNKIAKPIGREISSKKDHYCQPSFQACLFKGSPASDNVQCKSLGRAERKNVPMRHESAFQDSNYRWHRIGKSKADVNLESKEESPKCNNRKLSSEVPNSRMHEFKKKNDSTDKQKVHDQSKYPCRVSSSYDSSRNMEHHVNHYYFNHVNDHKYDSSKESPELRRSKSDTRNKYDYQRRSVMSSNEEVRPGSATERSYISCFSQDDCSGESKHNRKRNYLCTDGVDSGQDRNKNNSANELFTKVTHSQHWLSREITYSDRKIHSPSKNLGDRSLQRDPRLEISRHNKPRNRDEICHYEKRKIF